MGVRYRWSGVEGGERGGSRETKGRVKKEGRKEGVGGVIKGSSRFFKGSKKGGR